MKLYCIQVGAFRLPRGFVAARCENADIPTDMPIYAYLIEHPTKGLILVDTGQNYDLRDANTIMDSEDSIIHRLCSLGYTTDDVGYIVMSHLHLDHSGYMNEFPNSTFIVRKEELRSAWWPDASEGGYVFDTYDKTRRYKYIEPEDEEELDLFMDGSIILIDTRGHSRGHQSVILDLPKTGKTILACDAAPLREALDRTLLPGTCTDNRQAVRSIQKLKRLEDCGYTIVFPHDPDNPPSRAFPDYIE